MAQDTKATSGVPLNPGGMNDNIPLTKESDWYQTRGLHSITELCLQRMAGKSLVNKFDAPILSIHGDLRERIFIETTTTLYMFEKITDPIPI